MIDEILSYLICALIIWIWCDSLGMLLASVGLGWSALLVIGLLQ